MKLLKIWQSRQEEKALRRTEELVPGFAAIRRKWKQEDAIAEQIRDYANNHKTFCDDLHEAYTLPDEERWARGISLADVAADILPDIDGQTLYFAALRACRLLWPKSE